MTTNFDSMKKMLELYGNDAARLVRCIELTQELEQLLPEGELVIVGNGDMPTAENIAFVREWADYYERELDSFGFDCQSDDDDDEECDADLCATKINDLTDKKKDLCRTLMNILTADFD